MRPTVRTPHATNARAGESSPSPASASSMGITIPAETGASFTWGRPELLFEGPYLDDLARNYDLAPDGRFLMIKPAD